MISCTFQKSIAAFPTVHVLTASIENQGWTSTWALYKVKAYKKRLLD